MKKFVDLIEYVPKYDVSVCKEVVLLPVTTCNSFRFTFFLDLASIYDVVAVSHITQGVNRLARTDNDGREGNQINWPEPDIGLDFIALNSIQVGQNVC